MLRDGVTFKVNAIVYPNVVIVSITIIFNPVQPVDDHMTITDSNFLF